MHNNYYFSLLLLGGGGGSITSAFSKAPEGTKHTPVLRLLGLHVHGQFPE